MLTELDQHIISSIENSIPKLSGDAVDRVKDILGVFEIPKEEISEEEKEFFLIKQNVFKFYFT